ncbi:hypothetical protein scyTo_0016396 [Scyliorhinus torazame]|uniref:Aquaporin-9 n=1 Tax=Scyliorhinus torazame TaxID=75743 RepID=A0A401PQ41_SCYTO|nr:hypothetical protein [Scyliorhinus torazame]
MCVLGRLQWLKLPVYCIAQFIGAFVGSATVFGLYYDAFMAFDGGNLAITGQNATAQIFSSYPAPHLSFANGFADQIIGTAALLFSILAILDSKNDGVPKGLEPVVIGLIIMVIGFSMSFNCGGPINPARDLAPRLFTAMAGWGFGVFRAGDGWWWVPVIAPMIGGVVGTLVYVLIIELHHNETVPKERSCTSEQQLEAKAKYEMISAYPNNLHLHCVLKGPKSPYRMSKKPWGSITAAPFPLGHQKMTRHEIHQAVERLHSGRGARAPLCGYQRHSGPTEAESEQKHKALSPEKLQQLLDRLCCRAAEKASDQQRVPQGRLRDMGILNSYAWKGWN